MLLRCAPRSGLRLAVQPVGLLHFRELEQQGREQCNGRDDAENHHHACEWLPLCSADQRQLVNRMAPLECTENEHNLHQPGNPPSPDEKQSDQDERSENPNGLAVAHEMRAQDDQAQNDRDVKQHLFHGGMMAEVTGLLPHEFAPD